MRNKTDHLTVHENRLWIDVVSHTNFTFISIHTISDIGGTKQTMREFVKIFLNGCCYTIISTILGSAKRK